MLQNYDFYITTNALHKLLRFLTDYALKNVTK